MKIADRIVYMDLCIIIAYSLCISDSLTMVVYQEKFYNLVVVAFMRLDVSSGPVYVVIPRIRG